MLLRVYSSHRKGNLRRLQPFYDREIFRLLDGKCYVVNADVRCHKQYNSNHLKEAIKFKWRREKNLWMWKRLLFRFKANNFLVENFYHWTDALTFLNVKFELVLHHPHLFYDIPIKREVCSTFMIYYFREMIINLYSITIYITNFGQIQ